MKPGREWRALSGEKAGGVRHPQRYRQRDPRSTALYQIVERNYEPLKAQWPERFEEKYGLWRAEYGWALEEYLKCGILEDGAALVVCPECGASFLVGFSCKQRCLCPACSMKRALLFGEHLFKEVLARVPTSHIVFSIAKRFRGYFRSKAARTKLPVIAWRSVKAAYAKVSKAGRAALVLILHSAGGALQYNPHEHGMLPKGLFNADGTFTELEQLDSNELTLIFAQKVLRYLKKVDPENITDEVIEQVLSQEHTGFSVWIGPAVIPEQGLYGEFMARYIARGCIANSKVRCENSQVVHTNKEGQEFKFDELEFLACLVQHVAYRHESLIRYFGHYSYVVRGQRAKAAQRSAANSKDLSLARLSFELPAPDANECAGSKAASTWRALIHKVYGEDPLVCRKCGAVMYIKSFIIDPHEIAKVLKYADADPPAVEPAALDSS